MAETLRRLLSLAMMGLLVAVVASRGYCAAGANDGKVASATAPAVKAEAPAVPTAPGSASPAAVSASILTPGAAEPASIKHVVLRAPASHQDATAVSPKLTPGEILYRRANETERRDPINWSVMVYKSRHELIVYFQGRLLKKYSAVFGRNLIPGPKEWSEDRRTPEGVYTIIRKQPSLRFHWFLRLNYPNFVDRQRYQLLRAAHEVPKVDGHVLGVGGAIGIHGTDVPVLNQGLVNWTTGCISVSNRSIDELERLLPVGTVVIINH